MLNPVNGVAAFLEGLRVPLTGFMFMYRNPRLWRYGIWPILVNLILTGLVFVLLVAGGTYFASSIHPKFSPGFWGRSLEVLMIVFLFVSACGLAFAFWLVAQIAACGYFYGRLARQVEKLLGTKDDELIELPLMQEVTDTVRESLGLMVINFIFLLVQIIPVAGQIVGIGGSYYFSSLALGREFWDYPLALRGLRRKEKHEFARRHLFHTLGLGTAVMLLFLAPLVNAVLLTTAVTGAVLLHGKLQGKLK
jgi:uncharacterized protein involved in cysteine biosynthesis